MPWFSPQRTAFCLSMGLTLLIMCYIMSFSFSQILQTRSTLYPWNNRWNNRKSLLERLLRDITSAKAALNQTVDTSWTSDARYRHISDVCRRLQDVMGNWSGLVYSKVSTSTTIGLADRVRGTVFSFLISLATRRRFTLSLGLGCESAFEEVFDQGCIKWRDNTKLLKVVREHEWQNASIPMGFKDEALTQKIIKQMSTTELLSIGGKTNFSFLALDTNAVYYEDILRNPRYHDRLVQLLGLQNTADGDINFRTLGMLLLPMLFQPRPQIKQQIRSLIQKEGRSETEVGLVCAQLRLKERGGLRPLCDASCVRRAFDFLRISAKQWSKSAFFLGSDVASISSQFQQTCPECHVILPEGTLGHVGQDSRSDCSATRRAAWEMAMLAECDVLLLSRESGFGRIMPYLMRRNITQLTCFLDHYNTGQGCVEDEKTLMTAY